MLNSLLSHRLRLDVVALLSYPNCVVYLPHPQQRHNSLMEDIVKYVIAGLCFAYGGSRVVSGIPSPEDAETSAIVVHEQGQYEALEQILVGSRHVGRQYR